MRIDKLAIKGFLRFRDEIALDLSQLPPGLIAITGENGAGKTTLLEAPLSALYRQWMSRGDLAAYATGRDSFIDVQLATERGTYRARVNVDGGQKRTDGVLERLNADGTRTILNLDGKATSFDRIVADTFPSRTLAKASAFAAQDKSGSFMQMPKKDRRDLFVGELLGLSHLQTMSDTAKQAAAFVEQSRMRLKAVSDLLARETHPDVLTAIDRVANDLQAEGSKAEVQQLEVGAAIAQLEARLATVQDQVAAYAAATQRVRTLETELAARQAERSGVAQARGTALREAAAASQRDAAALQRKLQAFDETIAANQDLLAKADVVRAAVAAIAEVRLVLEQLRPVHQVVLQEIEKIEDAQRDVHRQLTTVDARKTELRGAEEGAALLERVPCGGAGEYASCQFLKNAKLAETKIPHLRTQVEAGADLQDALNVNSGQIAELKTRRDALARQIGELETRERSLQGDASYATALAIAEERIKSVQRERAAAVTNAEDATAAAAQRHAARLQELDERTAALDGAITRLTDDLATAKADLQVSAAGNKAAVELQTQLTLKRAERDDTVRTLAKVESGRLELRRRRNEVLAKRTRLDDVAARIQTLDAQLVKWQLLQRALSRDGLQDLEIDAAGPEISATTNELLAVGYGARFSLELVTQVPKADGKGMKEEFTVKVTDNEDGGNWRDIADLSGGERVVVAEALMNAIAIYVNTRSPMPMRTCWRDETTGALDAENALRYVAMLRKVQELGGFHHVFFISHNDDVKALADAQIVVADRQARIVLRPFGRQEIAA